MTRRNRRAPVLPFFERTLVIVKPDAVARGLTGEILGRFERAGLTIVGLKMLRPSLERAKAHYPTTVVQLEQMGNKTLSTYSELGIDAQRELGTTSAMEIGRLVHAWNAEFLSSAPIVVAVVAGVHAVGKVRGICGPTMPKDAPPGTIRGDLSSASPAVANVLKSAVYNLVHASDNKDDPREPEKEISHWFNPAELSDYSTVHTKAMFKLEEGG
jgi:nucleoside-diphosphate kinase